jgi:predicted PurR-regulated permease PerM
VLTFVGAFFPIVGALLTGALAALLALVAKGPVAAVIVIGVTIVIHNVEGYLVGPIVLGRAVKLHPIVVLIALTAGGAVGGIIGAFIAVPLTAAVINIIDYYRGKSAGRPNAGDAASNAEAYDGAAPLVSRTGPAPGAPIG